jgi:hypothetical protein
MEPIDAHVLDLIIREYVALPPDERDKALFVLAKLSSNIGVALADCENSVRNLMRLGLLKPGTVQGGLSFGEHTVSAYKDTEMFGVTNLGVIFHQSVST